MGGIAPSIGGRAGYAVDPLAPALGYIAWNQPGFRATVVDAPAAGFTYGAAVWIPGGSLITNVVLWVSVVAAGGVPTAFFVGIADKNQKMLAQSADLKASAALTTTGPQLFPLAGAPFTTPSDDLYYVVILKVGVFVTTQPAFALATQGNGYGKAIGTARIPFGVSAGGDTVLPANGSSLAMSAFNEALAVGVA